jgi:HSP20 family protein
MNKEETAAQHRRSGKGWQENCCKKPKQEISHMTKEERWLSFPQRISIIEQLFDEMIYRPWGRARQLSEHYPSVDRYETPQTFVLVADLPGFKKQDIHIEVEENVLVLRGEQSIQRRRGIGKMHYHERHVGYFERHVTLPVSIGTPHIQTRFRNGILQVVLPKRKEEKS